MFSFLHQICGANALLHRSFHLCRATPTWHIITFCNRWTHNWAYFQAIFSLFYSIIYTFWLSHSRALFFFLLRHFVHNFSLKISKIAFLVKCKKKDDLLWEFSQVHTKWKRKKKKQNCTSNRHERRKKKHKRTSWIENKYEKFITN